MRKEFTLIFIISILFACKSEQKKDENITQVILENTSKTSVKSYTYNELKPLLHKNDDKTYVVNFWATWCAPCVKELPAFEKINSEYKNKNVEVLLVSLDFPKQVDKRLIPFINNNKIKSKVVLLNDDNEQHWINDISKEWSGALPATLIYSKDKRKFFEQSFDLFTLENEVKDFIN